MQFIDTATNTSARSTTENMAPQKSDETIPLLSARRFRKFEACAKTLHFTLTSPLQSHIYTKKSHKKNEESQELCGSVNSRVVWRKEHIFLFFLWERKKSFDLVRCRCAMSYFHATKFLYFSYNSRALCTQINKLKLRVENTRYISKKKVRHELFLSSLFHSQYQKNFKAYHNLLCFSVFMKMLRKF